MRYINWHYIFTLQLRAWLSALFWYVGFNRRFQLLESLPQTPIGALSWETFVPLNSYSVERSTKQITDYIGHRLLLVKRPNHKQCQSTWFSIMPGLKSRHWQKQFSTSRAKIQSAYRRHHSTETAMLKVLSAVPWLVPFYLVDMFGINTAHGLDCHSYATGISREDAALRVAECITSLPADDSEQHQSSTPKRPSWSGLAPLAARQAYMYNATPIVYVGCWVWLSGHWSWRRRSGQSSLHVSASDYTVSRSYFYQMRQLRVVQRSLTKDVLRSLDWSALTVSLLV